MTAKERHREGVIAAFGMRCGLAHRSGCHGRLQADHVIEVQRMSEHLARRRLRGIPVPCLACAGRGWLPTRTIETIQTAQVEEPVRMEEVEGFDPCDECDGTGDATRDVLIADPRNGWMLCESHHSLKWILAIKRREVPFTVFDFARDYDLEWSIERDYPEAAA